MDGSKMLAKVSIQERCAEVREALRVARDMASDPSLCPLDRQRWRKQRRNLAHQLSRVERQMEEAKAA
jgi:hypothetical protein